MNYLGANRKTLKPFKSKKLKGEYLTRYSETVKSFV